MKKFIALLGTLFFAFAMIALVVELSSVLKHEAKPTETRIQSIINTLNQSYNELFDESDTRKLIQTKDPIFNNIFFINQLQSSDYHPLCVYNDKYRVGPKCKIRINDAKIQVRRILREGIFNKDQEQQLSDFIDLVTKKQKEKNATNYLKTLTETNLRDRFFRIEKVRRNIYKKYKLENFSIGKIKKFHSSTACEVNDGNHNIFVSSCDVNFFNLNDLVIFSLENIEELEAKNGFGATVYTAIVSPRYIFSCNADTQCFHYIKKIL